MLWLMARAVTPWSAAAAKPIGAVQFNSTAQKIPYKRLKQNENQINYYSWLKAVYPPFSQ